MTSICGASKLEEEDEPATRRATDHLAWNGDETAEHSIFGDAARRIGNHHLCHAGEGFSFVGNIGVGQ